MTMTGLTDEEREYLIDQLSVLSTRGTKAVRLYWWSMMKCLIDGRSAAQVARMEREKHLDRVA